MLRPSQRRRWVILSVLIISLMAIVLDNTVLNIALKTIAEPRTGLGASQSQLEWAINSYTLVFAGLLFTFGVIGDRIGRKRMLMIGMAMFGLASLLSSYAQTPDQLIWARAAMGLGGAAVMPQTLSIITNVFEPKERARAIGIWAAAVGMAIAIGPIVGGLLLDHFWWGSVFLINVPLTAVGMAAIVVAGARVQEPVPGRIDYLGVLLSIAGPGAGRVRDHPGRRHRLLAARRRARADRRRAGGAGRFGWHEARIEHPSLDVRLFRDPRLSSATAAHRAGVLRAVRRVLLHQLLPAERARLQPAARRPADHPARRRPAAAARRARAALCGGSAPRRWCTAGLLVVACALVGYHLLGTTTPIWVLEAAFFVQGAAMGTVMPLATEGVMSVVPRERGGAGSAITNTSRQVAVALGRGRARVDPGPGLPAAS